MRENLSERFSILDMFSFLIPLLEVIKVIIASVASVIFLGFAGLTLAGTATAFAISTPIFIIFSPILVPAGIATAVLTTGLTAGGSFASTAFSIIMWLIKRKLGLKAKSNRRATPNSTSGFMYPGVSLAKLGGGVRGRLRRRIIKRIVKRIRSGGGGGLPGIGKGLPSGGMMPGGKIGKLLSGKLKDRLKGLGGMSPGGGGGLLPGGGGGKIGELLGGKLKDKLKGLGGMSGSEGSKSGSEGGLLSGSEGDKSGSEGDKSGSEGGKSGSEGSKSGSEGGLLSGGL